MNTPQQQTIRIMIPLKIRQRNGRPRILPPATTDAFETERSNPRVLRAIGRAWSWRRKLERGEAATLKDIAQAEKVTDRFISRMLRLAYLAPSVMEQILLHRRPIALSINDLAEAAGSPWDRQARLVFGE